MLGTTPRVELGIVRWFEPSDFLMGSGYLLGKSFVQIIKRGAAVKVEE